MSPDAGKWPMVGRTVGFLAVVGMTAAIMSAGVSAGCPDHRFTVDVRGGLATLRGGSADSARFTVDRAWGGGVTYCFHERWTLGLSLTTYQLFNDSTAGSGWSFGGDATDATLKWRATRIGLLAGRRLLSGGRISVAVGLGGGLMTWKFMDPPADTILTARGARNEEVSYRASELFVTGCGSMEVSLSDRFSLKWRLQVDHLTTAGAEFRVGVNSSRPRWLMGSLLAVGFSFGGRVSGHQWRSETAWQTVTPDEPKSTATADIDGDGVPDKNDDCPGTPAGARVDRRGCAMDSDGDGVNDEWDDCPNTEPRAAGRVDIFGCPVDSDFDGIPDYLDGCPANRIGAIVDARGCPIDSDLDGVPDGLDDCPHTLWGADVDRHGCIDLPFLNEPMILHIDYVPGSFEVDPANQERLEELARVLNFVPDIKLEITGYTDNIGQARANQDLSEKRARRVRDYLVVMGVAEDRIKVFGRGESNFIAPNDTARGRSQNRRVEIVFFR
ncbi:MAG: OmpA family protein [bacterium]